MLIFVFWTLNQANHRFTTNVQRRIYGHSTEVAIRPLNEEKAVQAAAELLGELFVFTVLSSPSFIPGLRILSGCKWDTSYEVIVHIIL